MAANLALTDNATVDQYTSIGEAAFDYTFPIKSTDELKVSVDQVLQTIAIDYTVSGVGDAGGGTVTFLSATTAGEIITLWQEIPFSRLTGFATGAATLLGEDLNTEFVRQLRIDQELARDIARCVRLAVDDPGDNAALIIPDVASRIGKYIRFADPSGDLELATELAAGTSLSASVIGGFLYPVLAAETAAAAATGGSVVNIHRPYYHLERYGNNTTPGTTDMRVPLLMAAESAKGAGAVRLQGQTYLIGDSGATMAYRASTAKIGVALPSNTVIEGEGFNTVLTIADASDVVPLTADSQSKLGLRNLRIEGNAVNQSSDRAFGVYFLDCDEINLENVWVHDTYSNTHEFLGCSNITGGQLYAETATPASIGGGPQFEDCTDVDCEILGSTLDDLCSIISHAADCSDFNVRVTGKSAQARALFIGLSGTAGAQYTMENITGKVNSHECGVIGLTGAFVINRGAIYQNIHVKVVDRDSYQSTRITPYDGTYHGKLYNSTFDIQSYNASTFGIEVRHDDHVDTDIENCSLKALVRNPNVGDAATNDGIRIQGGDRWDIDVSIEYPAGKTNVGVGLLLAVAGGTNNKLDNPNVKGIIRGGSPNIRYNNGDGAVFDGLVLLESEETNNINLDILSASVTNARLGTIVRDGEIQDLGVGTQRNIVKLYSSGTEVSSSGAGEDDLMSYTLPADWMGKTGVLHLKAAGTYVGGAGNSTLKFYLGTTAVTLQGPSVVTGDWNVDIYITEHTTRAEQAIDIVVYHGNTVILNDHATATEVTTAALAIKLTGECANAGDTITQKTMLIEGY